MEKQSLRERFKRISQHLDEKSRRLWCANEAVTIGYGGVSLVASATGVSRTTITEGKKEITGKKYLPKEKVRREGGGRKQKTEQDKSLKRDVEKLVEPHVRGDPAQMDIEKYAKDRERA